MAHDHSHDTDQMSDRRLVIAVGLNLLLTFVEAAAGLLAGSLALLADALHNFNDCGALVLALIARRIGRRPSDEFRTFGYRRAEVIGALINLTLLVVIGLYLVYEAITRFFQPQAIDGWIVVGVSVVALVIDLGTAALLLAMSRGNLNMRAAYLHNLSDALSSVGVIIAGAAILWFGVTWVDPVATLVIAGFILWQSVIMMRRSIHILMEGAPADVDPNDLTAALQSIEGVIEIHHLHLWELDERRRAMEAHVVVDNEHIARWADIKREIKRQLADRYHIHHSTVEFESPDEEACQPCPPSGDCHC
jgi:cobalt-zinc-cadmium efflux system protein